MVLAIEHGIRIRSACVRIPLLVEEATAAITQSLSDLVNLIAIVCRKRKMVQANAAAMVASTNVVVWRLNPDKIEAVPAPTPPFGPRLEGLVAEQAQKPVPEMRRPLKIGDVDLDVRKHHSCTRTNPASHSPSSCPKVYWSNARLASSAVALTVA